MKKNLILVSIFFTIFLDFFNLGLIYPIFTSLVFEGSGELISSSASSFYKNAIFGVLIALFPFGQFLGAPVIGHLSDQYGRRKLLIISLVGTVVTLLVCALGVLVSSLPILFLGRFFGGLMAGNMTLAYASLADFSSQEEKVKNFALIPLATGVGFAGGPYLAGVLANPDILANSVIHFLAGPALPFFFASVLALVTLFLVFWKFPETTSGLKKENIMRSLGLSVKKLGSAFGIVPLRPYLGILFLMISANFVFVQFVGPFAIDRFGFNVTEVGYLYANIGISVSLGHIFLTRRLANRYSPENALSGSLVALSLLLIALLVSHQVVVLHVLTFLIMLACAVAYTNAMALVSNQASQEQQGEVMGVAVSIQSCSEFLPAVILGLIASISQTVPLLSASVFAGGGYCILLRLMSKVAKKVSS